MERVWQAEVVTHSGAAAGDGIPGAGLIGASPEGSSEGTGLPSGASSDTGAAAVTPVTKQQLSHRVYD